MNNQRSHTAILLFARTIPEEIRHKKFTYHNRPKTSEKIAWHLFDHTLEKIQCCQLPYFHFSEREQRGSSFGEKLANAINAVFNKGFDHVITIGADCPELTPRDILEADKALNIHQAVLGPAKDGGLYLIGLTSEAFDPEKFKKIHWCSGNDCEELRSVVGERVRMLRTKRDVDQPDALKFLMNCRLISRRLYHKLVLLLNFIEHFNLYFQAQHPVQVLGGIPSRRGPPHG